MTKVKMIRDHNGYAEGETVELEPAVADVFVNHVQCAEYIAEPPKLPVTDTASDKMMRRRGGKSKVVTK